MADGVATSMFNSVWPVNVAVETFLVVCDGSSTTITITPTSIKQILSVSAMPATSSTDIYLTAQYAETAVFACTASASYVITVYGVVA